MSSLTPRPGILEISPYVPGQSSIPGHDNPMKLASNENPLGASPKAIAAYKAEADRLHIYPDGGHAALRAAIGKRYGLDPARLICGAGSDELLALLGRAYAGPGDEVISTRHGFSIYPIVARSVGATPVIVEETDLRADVDKILAAVTPRTRIVFLANPNNPTGSYLPTEELTRLRAALPAQTLLVLDAAYCEFVARNDYEPGIRLVDANDNVVMTRTFSKIHGLAALRLGWMYAPAEICDVMNRVRGPFNVSAPALIAGIAAVEDVSHEERSKAHNAVWLAWLTAEIEKLGLQVYPSVANFVLVRFPAEPGRDADAAVAHLHEAGIIPRKLGSYSLPDCLRISIGLEEEMKAVRDALATFMGRA